MHSMLWEIDAPESRYKHISVVCTRQLPRLSWRLASPLCTALVLSARLIMSGGRARARGGGGQKDDKNDGAGDANADDGAGAGGGEVTEKHKTSSGTAASTSATAPHAYASAFALVDGGPRGAISAKPVWVSKAAAAEMLARDVAAAAVFADTYGTDVFEHAAAVEPAAAARAAKRARADDVADGGVAKRVEYSSRADAPSFGERVEAPPRLSVKPRAPRAERQAASIALALAPKAQKAPKLDKRAREAARRGLGLHKAPPPAPPSAAREAVLDAERDAARAAFAAMKVRRREAFAAAAAAAARGAKGTGATGALRVVA